MEWQFWNTNILLQILLITALWHIATPCRPDNETIFLIGDDRHGSDVVQAVISKLHSVQILTCDHRLLRRIALVETNDGTAGVPDGGIWALDERKFNVIASEVDKELSNKLCLNKTGGTPYTFLGKPLISGLAASLYLVNITANASIPLAENIEQQAQFWIKHYHSRGLSAEDFVEQVKSKCGLVFF